MSLYRKGIEGPSVKVAKTVSVAGETKTSGMGGVIVLGVIAVGGIFLMTRKKPTPVGPDTSDIDARIRARGLDPSKYY